MVKERLIDKNEAVRRVEPEQLAQYLYPIFEQGRGKEVSTDRPWIAGRGRARLAEKIALTPDQAVALKARRGKGRARS